jgi:hypothetical protein
MSFAANDSDNEDDNLYDDIQEDVTLMSSNATYTIGGLNTEDSAVSTDAVVTAMKSTSMNADGVTQKETKDTSNETISYDFLSSTNLHSNSNHIDNERPKNSFELIPILQDQIRQLQNENAILKRNIGILYRTAISEIQRKDQQILQQQLQQQSHST